MLMVSFRPPADSDLTAVGERQALHIKTEWDKERASGMPFPDIIYTSPLLRALRTCDIALGALAKDSDWMPVVVIEVCV